MEFNHVLKKLYKAEGTFDFLETLVMGGVLFKFLMKTWSRAPFKRRGLGKQ